MFWARTPPPLDDQMLWCYRFTIKIYFDRTSVYDNHLNESHFCDAWRTLEFVLDRDTAADSAVVHRSRFGRVKPTPHEAIPHSLDAGLAPLLSGVACYRPEPRLPAVRPIRNRSQMLCGFSVKNIFLGGRIRSLTTLVSLVIKTQNDQRDVGRPSSCNASQLPLLV